MAASKPPTKKPRTLPSRPDALLVKCKDTASYAEVLRAVQNDESLQKYRENVTKIRRTAAGELLLQMEKVGDDATAKLLKAVQEKMGELVEAKTITKKVMLEVKDIPEWCSATDVLDAVFAKIDGDMPVEATPKLRAAYRGTQTARVLLPKNLAEQLLKIGKIRIGWAICRIRHKTIPRRCFKCLEFGHIATRCRSSHNETGKCYNCGGTENASKACQEKPACILYTRKGQKNPGHSTLSRSCPLFLKAANKRN